MTPDDAIDAASTSALIEELYGEPLGRMEGVLHVVACLLDGGTLSVLRIGEHAPKSAHDFFALELARARCDAILTTGAILRAEPELRCGLRSAGLRAWRRDVLGVASEARVLVLTTGRNFPLDHPMLAAAGEGVIVLAPAGAGLRLPSHVELVTEEAPTPRSAIALLIARGARGVSIEAGPSVARGLYDPPAVDEVMLSIFEGEVVPEARGPRLLRAEFFDRNFVCVARAVRDEPSGRWTFSRWLSRDRRGSAAGSR
ncbi:MAG: hypothetical protein IT378_03675 [Sandaracinaceae bacterium]|nr:hypothetical protein [Sandaracinaceae bacterium]